MRVVYVDMKRCLGCFNCERACSLRNYRRCRNAESNIKVVVDLDHRVIQTSTCRQCRSAPCEKACPTGALLRDAASGILAVAQELCTGCAECSGACPFGNIRILGQGNLASKCDLCGGRPQCVEVCQARALQFGTLNDVIRLNRANKEPRLAVRTVECEEPSK